MRNTYSRWNNNVLYTAIGTLNPSQTIRNVETVSSARGDVQHVIPINGFRGATDYSAHRALMIGEEFSYKGLIGPSEVTFSGISAPPQPYFGLRFGSTGTWPDLRPLTDANQIAKVETEALLKLNESDIDLGVALVEAKSTYSMVASAMLNVLKAYKAILKLRPKDAIGYLGLVRTDPRLRGILARKPAQQWLQLQFGWLPLLSDIHGAIQTLQRDWKFDHPVLSVVRNNKQDLALPSSAYYDLLSVGASQRLVQAKYYYTIENRVLYMLNNLGLVNPLSVGWEVVPFSFVLDWFVPVGNFLRAFSSTTGIDFLGGYTTIVVTSAFTSSWKSPSATYVDGKRETYRVKSKFFERRRHVTAPHPQIYVDLRFSKRKALSSLALLSELRYRR